MTVTRREHDDITARIQQWRQGFASVNPEALAELWAGDDERLVYVAGERSDSFGSRVEIARYYRDALGPVGTVTISEIADLIIDSADGMARAFFDFRYAGTTVDGEAFDVGLRVTVVLRRHPDGWRFAHYHESSPGPL